MKKYILPEQVLHKRTNSLRLSPSLQDEVSLSDSHACLGLVTKTIHFDRYAEAISG